MKLDTSLVDVNVIYFGLQYVSPPKGIHDSFTIRGGLKFGLYYIVYSGLLSF